MNSEILKNEQGFTIVEVLVGAFIFMLGFSVLIFMLSQLMVNYSVDEISTANRIAQNNLEMVIVSHDTISQNLVVIQSNVKYSVMKRVTVSDNLAKVNVEVKRHSKEKILCRLYYEFAIPAE
ncbi:MAG: prepilin-type N-terminal cleavage/methylation domain-containing protein [candidate division Zixibacteria bacterium]|nr:prepilin-type N-terminal cleavage/methylation domain-containing protein [candidate division Zixibacteria bacterium]